MAPTITTAGGKPNYNDHDLYKTIGDQLGRRLYQARHKISEKLSEIICHKNYDLDDLPCSEMSWLSELLLWEQACESLPWTSTSSLLTTVSVPGGETFPGVRHRPIEEQVKRANNDFKDCAQCFRLRTDQKNCPLNRVVSCGTQGHPDFIIRYGRENFDGLACPLCRKELERKFLSCPQNLYLRPVFFSTSSGFLSYIKANLSSIDRCWLFYPGQEVARKELETKELQRQETEREELERKAIECKALKEQMESKELKFNELLKALELKETERKELERKELERKDLEHKEREREESERKKHMRHIRERQELERQELNRQKLVHQELLRQEFEQEQSELNELGYEKIKRKKAKDDATDKEEDWVLVDDVA